MMTDPRVGCPGRISRGSHRQPEAAAKSSNGCAKKGRNDLREKVFRENGQDALERFRREVCILKSPYHPRVMKVLDDELGSEASW